MPMPAKLDPKKYCRHCRARLHRKRYNGRLEDLAVFRRRKFCDKICMEKAHEARSIISRSGYLWRARRHLKNQCEMCCKKKKLQIHHEDRDWKNNDPKNLRTLCAPCHRKLHWAEDKQRENRRKRMLVLIISVDALIEETRRLALGRVTEKRIKNVAALALSLRQPT